MATLQDPQTVAEMQPSSHDSHDMQNNHQNTLVTKASGQDPGSSTFAESKSKKVSRADIELVQNLIERCLQLYMNKGEVIRTLSNRARIEPGFTALVWKKLEEENPEFFRAYYIRLKLKKQIILFNQLLEHQYHLMKYPIPSKVPLVPMQNGIHPVHVNNLPMGYPVLQPQIPTPGQLHVDPMACVLSSYHVVNGIPAPCNSLPIRMNTGNDDTTESAPLAPQCSTMSPMSEMAVTSASVESNQFSFTPSEITMGMDASAIDTIFTSDVLNTRGLQLGADGVTSSIDSIRSLGQLWNFSLSDLTADMTNLGDFGALGDYTGSPFLPSDSDILLDSPDQDDLDFVPSLSTVSSERRDQRGAMGPTRGAVASWLKGRTFSSSSSSAASLNKKWDAVVVGGGHNGLTAAAYLARAGLSVAVLERRHVLGGAAVTEEIVPGFRFSRCSYLQSLLRPSVIRELELTRHGLKLLRRSPSSFTPCLDGRYLLLGPDASLNHSEIAKFSKKDALAFPRYEEQLKKFCEFMDHLLDSPTPEARHDVASLLFQVKDKLRKSTFWGHILQQTVRLGQKDMLDFMDLLLSPASKVLNNWFETEVLKATLATDAVIGSMASVHTPGSGYVLLHHVMGETDGERGVWSYVEGGMGSVSLAISNAAREAGVHVVTNAEVDQVIIDENTGVATGVALRDGTKVHSSSVLSNATPYKTFMELVPPNILTEDFLRLIKNIDYSSGTTKINLAVSRLPQFGCCNAHVLEPGPQHVGTIHIGSESMESIDIACKDALNGMPSRRPVIEMTIPSVLDRTISPPGQHVINLFIQYTPYALTKGSWQDPNVREAFAQSCFSLIDEYAPGFSSSIIGYDMLTPPDLEREFGLSGGNIFHGAMGLDSMFLMRPVKGWSDYRTPVKGLYLCGSGTHPGGGVMGAPGRNAASVVIDDMKKMR